VTTATAACLVKAGIRQPEEIPLQTLRAFARLYVKEQALEDIRESLGLGA